MKVILIGKGPGWATAPMKGEVWGVNDIVLKRPVKLAFEIHPISRVLESRPEEIEEINRLGIPVITSGKHKALPNAIVFPLDEMPVKYFTSGVSYMIAYAIHKGATEIEMYGVALVEHDEYAYQRPCIEFWIGYALAQGIKVTVHGYSTIECCGPKKLYGELGILES